MTQSPALLEEPDVEDFDAPDSDLAPPDDALSSLLVLVLSLDVLLVLELSLELSLDPPPSLADSFFAPCL
jgi:hypothetical protein